MNKAEFTKWFTRYKAAFADELNVTKQEAARMIDEDMARRLADKGWTPERAGRSDARFCAYGE